MKRIFLLLCISLILTSCGKIEKKIVVKDKDKSQIFTIIKTEIEDTEIEEIEPEIIVEVVKKEITQEINKEKETVFINTIENPKEKIVESTGTNIVEIDFEIVKSIDYNNCIISKEQYAKIPEDFKGKFGEYDNFCLPKSTIIGTIKQGDIDSIDIYSCINIKSNNSDMGKYTPYTLSKYKPGDNTFTYNIAHDFDNICKENNRNYIFKYYKDGKELKEININKEIKSEKLVYKENLCYLLEGMVQYNYCINNGNIEISSNHSYGTSILKIENNNLITSEYGYWFVPAVDSISIGTTITKDICNLDTYKCEHKSTKNCDYSDKDCVEIEKELEEITEKYRNKGLDLFEIDEIKLKWLDQYKRIDGE